LRQLRACELSIGQALVDDALEGECETHGVSSLAVVETKRLFIKVAEQMERFDGYIGALEGALQETPEVLKAIGMDLAINVCLGVIDDVVNVVTAESLIGEMRVGVQGRASLNVLRTIGWRWLFFRPATIAVRI
jgi:hypothetical protein